MLLHLFTRRKKKENECKEMKKGFFFRLVVAVWENFILEVPFY